MQHLGVCMLMPVSEHSEGARELLKRGGLVMHLDAQHPCAPCEIARAALSSISLLSFTRTRLCSTLVFWWSPAIEPGRIVGSLQLAAALLRQDGAFMTRPVSTACTGSLP